MKYNLSLLSFLTVMIFTIAGCGSLDYKKTKSGLLYKIISSGNSKNPIAKENNYLKFNVVTKLNDSVIYSSYGKMPGYSKVVAAKEADYSPVEIFGMLKKGDSAITVSMIDTFLKRGMANQLPPGAKKGDRMVITFKVLDVFTNDSAIQKDYNSEMVKDKPRQQKEMQEQMAIQKKQIKEMRAKQEEDWRKSGEIDKELKNMESYLASKKITAQQTGSGTFVVIKQQGTGASVKDEDTVTVKYTGRILATDSVFQSDSYTFPLGEAAVIQGWDEGIKLFKVGGKGTIYIPGFLAYGANARPPFRAFEALIFDVELTNARLASPGTK
ncbi:MAG TPA: FKBP-type peptidyl-prolyl cis-trans isomerase [Chitinophagaceae bacterium]|nr:FKBP-type peptidyl-prolyl cis-trans isomerase [Chitinophagaceae bacterium]